MTPSDICRRARTHVDFRLIKFNSAVRDLSGRGGAAEDHVRVVPISAAPHVVDMPMAKATKPSNNR
jgi:hypothetical protein